eukprot:10610373-Ditylum_brightwellii.AAC.1
MPFSTTRSGYAISHCSVRNLHNHPNNHYHNKHNNQLVWQTGVSPEQETPLPQQQNRQNHRNFQTHDNCHNPNFEPAYE